MGTLADVRDVTDDDLIDDLRAGRNDAFAELYRRHAGAARGYARSLLRSEQDAEDAVADAFTCILAALRNEAGPRDGFRAYLLTSVRHHCARRARQRARSDGSIASDRPSLDAPAPERVVEHHLVHTAFARLHPRWRTVLWLTEVEQREPADVAARTGIDMAGVATALYRAREGFAESYLAEHLERATSDSCARFAPKLTRYVRGTAGDMTRRQVDAHLSRCAACTSAVRELEDVNQALRSQLTPALVVTATMSAGGAAGGLSLAAGGAALGWLAKAALVAAAAVAVPVALTTDVDRSSAAATTARAAGSRAIPAGDSIDAHPASATAAADAGAEGGTVAGASSAPDPTTVAIPLDVSGRAAGAIGPSPEAASSDAGDVARPGSTAGVPDGPASEGTASTPSPLGAVPLPASALPVAVTVAVQPTGTGVDVGLAAEAGPVGGSAAVGPDGIAVTVAVTLPVLPGATIAVVLPAVTLPSTTATTAATTTTTAATTTSATTTSTVCVPVLVVTLCG